MIEKATKQLFHVYPFFNPDILMFSKPSAIKTKMDSLEGTLSSKAYSKSTSKAKYAK